MTKSDFYEFLRKIPKAEIHLHAEGVISKKTVEQFLEKNPNKTISDVKSGSLFSYKNLKEFISSFLFIQNLFEKPSDLAILFDDVTAYLLENNIVYCELFFSPSLLIKKGFNFDDMLQTIHQAIAKIEKEHPVRIKLIIDLSRTFGVDNAKQNLSNTLHSQLPIIVGVGLGGDELKGPAREFAEVFQTAKQKGLHVVAHAGEDDGPQSIWDALKLLNVERIGHGISAIQDQELISFLAQAQIPVEICLTSNLFTQRFVDKAEKHPVRPFFDQGVLVTINTDDPTFFDSNLIDEYWKLHSKLKFTMTEIKQLVINGFKASFLEDSEKEKYISQVEAAWATHIKAKATK